MLAAVPAAAEGPYRLVRTQEYWWLGVPVALWTGSTIAITRFDPLTTGEIAALEPGDINEFDRDRMQPYRDDHAGDALAVGSYLLPLTLFARDDTRRDVRTLAVIWVETTMWNQAFASIAKATARRTRPYVYDPLAPDDIKQKQSARTSFYSAHTASASANYFFMAKVLSDYMDNRGAEIAIWCGAAILPALNGFYRVDSGHHFTTDVITGYAMGAAVGILVPFLHQREDSRLSFEPVNIDGAPGIAASVSF